MSDAPGEHLEPEPQDERGAPGSRDTGSNEPAGGPAQRPAGTSDEQSDSSVDAQDLFFAGQTARVTAVLSDVDDQVHVAVVLVDDPAADLHDWYGRYLYFAPDELEPLGPEPTTTPSPQREESRP